MNNKGNEMTTAIWFDRWVKEADNRRLRQRQVAETLDFIGSLLVVVGLLFCIVGAAWIDSMDITRDNVLLMFAGVALTWGGSRLKWVLR